MDRLLLTLGIIFAGLAAGYAFQGMVRAGRLRLSVDDMTSLRRRMQRAAVFGLIPFSAMLSLWGLPAPDVRLLALPLLGLAAWLWGGVLAILFSGWLKLNRAQTGSMYCCGTFTNIGAVGALVCVLFLGENTIALAALYRLCEELLLFSVVFPISRRYGMEPAPRRFSLEGVRVEPVVYVVIAALLSGIVLNVLEVPRPEAAGRAASGAMVLAAVLFLAGIGMSLRLSCIHRYTQPAAAVCVIKFLGVPVVITGTAWLIGFGDIDGGLPLRVVAVLSSMPVAMTALIPPSLFALDLDLANACWVYSTAGLVVVLPILLIVLPRL